MKKIVLLAFVLMFLSTAVVVRFVRPVVADGTIFIRADGSIDPPGANITSVNNITYYFTDNINESIYVERDNIVIDGAGYTIQGTGMGAGIDLSGSNVTIRNMRIRSFYSGILLWHSSNNSIFGNTIRNNEYGIRLYRSSSNSIFMNNITNNEWDGIDLWRSSNNNNISGNNVRNNGYGIYLHYSSDNTISGNNITANNQFGIYLYRSSNNNIYHNNFIDNPQQVNIRSSTNFWDDGAGKGNYWGDYEERYPNAMEINDSGIWDTTYEIDENNQDRYPLMQEEISPPPAEEEEVPFWMEWWFWAIVTVGIVALAGAVYLKKRKPPTPTAPTLPPEGTSENTTQNTNPLNSYLPSLFVLLNI